MSPTKHPYKVAYVAAVDLPDNRRAHAMQMLKNGQAWSQCVTDFEFVTNVWRSNMKRLTPENMASFYGLTHPFKITGLPVRRFELSQRAWVRELYFSMAAWRCKLRGLDFVYTRSYQLLRHSLKRGLPTIVETHSPPGRTPEIDAMLSLTHEANFVALTTISEPLAQMYRDFGVPKEKVMVLPDGVDLERFEAAHTIQEARTKLGLPQDQVIGTYVGHLYDGRGIDTMLEAAKQKPEVLFLIVGGYPKDIERWQAVVSAMGLNNIRFEGFVANDQVPLYLWAGDFLMMPYGQGCATKDWMSPLKLFEYMAAGRAIISSDFPILREVLADGKNGLLFEPDDGAGLAQAMTRVMEDTPMRQAMGEAALKEVAQYSWVKRVEKVIEHFEAWQA
ncbi:glycosyltransferase family 4 protein [Magnetococcus sp. PR-3]|uniref:glycosyltransferase family 4 protein n=1 Tax=Magnetococcus sp. PR-3 TaxID=3120355 RepID=UPI002FCE24C1